MFEQLCNFIDTVDLGVYGPVLSTVAGMTALRPVSEILLIVSRLVGSKYVAIGKLIYFIGQLAGFFTVSKPLFTADFKCPAKKKEKAQ